MPIALKIISYQRLTPGQQALFNSALDRFSIGRNRDNHWTLPDPQRFMSGTHCWLELRDGTWFLTDTSTNGVYINGSDRRVQKNDSVAIANGDRIRLGDYELEVETGGRVTAAPGPASDDTDPFDEHDWDVVETPQVAERGQPTPSAARAETALPSDSLSIDALFQLGEPAEDAAAAAPSLARQGDQASAMEQHFRAPSVASTSPSGGQACDLPDKYVTPATEIPENWDEDTDLVQSPGRQPQPEPNEPLAAPPTAPGPQAADSAPPPPAATTEGAGPTPASPAHPATRAAMPAARPAPMQAPATAGAPAVRVGDAAALVAFATGAGLDPRQLNVEDEAAFFIGVGELLRTMTQGVMQAIASRGQIKSEFRLEQTMIAPTRNNPLKFSVSAQEALVRLLASTDGAYLAGPDAAAEAIDDINAHQMAVLAGTEAALKSLLRRFKPATLESRLGGDSTLAKAMPVLRKAKYWEFYKALYDEVSEATGDDFQKFFGSEFSDAYEKQLERLKTSRKETHK